MFISEILARKGGTNLNSDNESDDLSGSLSTLGVASPLNPSRSPSLGKP